jgi:hypothetical protein
LQMQEPVLNRYQRVLKIPEERRIALLESENVIINLTSLIVNAGDCMEVKCLFLSYHHSGWFSQVTSEDSRGAQRQGKDFHPTLFRPEPWWQGNRCRSAAGLVSRVSFITLFYLETWQL